MWKFSSIHFKPSWRRVLSLRKTFCLRLASLRAPKSFPRTTRRWTCNSKGFTLIETILAMVVLAIGIFGTMHLFYQSAGRAFETDAYIQATSLARQKVEEIIFDKKMRGYAYVVGANYPSSETLAAPYDDYTRTLSMTEVNPSDLSSIQNNSGYKKVNVVVNWNGGSVTLETLVTLWGEL